MAVVAVEQELQETQEQLVMLVLLVEVVVEVLVEILKLAEGHQELEVVDQQVVRQEIMADQ
jgi:hypothetical protein